MRVEWPISTWAESEMPIYAYKCTNGECLDSFEKHLPLSEFDNDQGCPSCGSLAEKRVSGVGFVLKGDAWPGKNIRIKNQMAAKNKRLSVKQNERKKDAPPVTLAPNVDGERVGSWAEAKKLAASKGKATSTYDALVRKEKRGDT